MPPEDTQQLSVLKQQILDSMDQAIILIGLDGLILYVNQKAIEMLRCEDSSLLGKPITHFILETDISLLLSPPTLKIEQLPIFFQRGDGTSFAAACNIRLLKDGDISKILIWFSESICLSSISDQNLVNLKLLRAVLDYSPNYIYVKDLSHRFLLLNKTFIDSLMLRREELKLQKANLEEKDFLGKKDSEIFPAEYAEKMTKDDDRVVQSGKPINVEYSIQIQGVENCFLVSKAPLYDSSGHIFAICGIASDITYKKNAEKKLNDYLTSLEQVTTQLMEARLLSEQANIAKSSFLANMSHEIRTPLHGVIATASLLINTELTEKQQVYVDRIVLSANILLDIINRILEFSKIESGEFKLELGKVDLFEVIASSSGIIIAKAEEKGLRLLIDIKEDVPKYVIGDATRIKQVILNLFGNAIKFTKKGYIKLTAFCLNKTTETALVRFEIMDTGMGISQEDQEKLFEKFFQIDHSSRRKHGGTGIGLAITKQLVTKMGGKIGLESTPDSGSTFWFEIPFSLAKE